MNQICTVTFLYTCELGRIDPLCTKTTCREKKANRGPGSRHTRKSIELMISNPLTEGGHVTLTVSVMCPRGPITLTHTINRTHFVLPTCDLGRDTRFQRSPELKQLTGSHAQRPQQPFHRHGAQHAAQSVRKKGDTSREHATTVSP